MANNSTTELDLLKALTTSGGATDTLNVVTSSSSLPTGAATSAKQDTGNTSLASIDGKLASLGQKAMSGSAPVVLSSDQSAVPITLPDSKSLSNSITASSQTVTLSTAGYASVLMDVQGTFSGSLNVTATVDGTNYFSWYGISVSTLNQIASVTSSDQVKFDVVGIQTFKITSSGWVSGTAVVSLVTSRMPSGQVSPFTGTSSDSGAFPIVSASNLAVTAGCTQVGTWNVVASNSASARNDTYTATGNGTTVTVNAGLKNFAIQVVQTGTITAWDVRIEGALDGTNFTQILQHTNVTGSGVTLFTGAAASPCTSFRSRCAGLTKGAGTNVIAYIVGLP